jgi:hypothetical protein
MRNYRQKISDFVLQRAEMKAHYKTSDLSISNFELKHTELKHDANDPHDSVILNTNADNSLDATLFNLEMSFYNQRYDFIRKHIKKPAKIVEIGDVNGFNIENFGNDQSLSINFVDYSENIKNKFKIMDVNKGINLDEKFEYGMMFETLEHLHNPILVLNQMLDICESGVILSIPHVRKTYARLNLGGGHVFEFSPDDFKRILDYYGITIVDYNVCNVLKLDLLTRPFKLHSILKGTPDELFGVFENFQLYYLIKKH